MVYRPDYQRRYGNCKSCRQGIEAGDKIMVGTGYFNGHMVRIHDHYDCWLTEVLKRSKDWFFAHEFKPNRMTPEIKAELNRLRARRYYVQQKGGDADEIKIRVEAINKQVALVKAGNKF